MSIGPSFSPTRAFSAAKATAPLLRAHLQLTPSRVGAGGPVLLPNSDAPSEQLCLSGEIPHDPEADKFEVRTVRLDKKTQFVLASKALLGAGVGPIGFSQAFESMMERADAVQVEVPKSGQRPLRDPEVWLVADGSPLMPETEKERAIVVEQYGTRDPHLDGQVSAVTNFLDTIREPGQPQETLAYHAAVGLAERLTTRMGPGDSFTADQVNRASTDLGKDLGIPLAFKPADSQTPESLPRSLASHLTGMIEKSGVDEGTIRSALDSTMHKHWGEQREAMENFELPPGVDWGAYVTPDGSPLAGEIRDEFAEASFKEMARSLASDLATDVLPGLLRGSPPAEKLSGSAGR